MRILTALTIVCFSFAVRANSVTNQVVVSSSQSTQANPRSTVFTNMLNGSLDVAEDWTLSAGANLTLAGNTASADRAQFARSGAVALFNLGLDWLASENWVVGATLELSPTSTQFAGSATTVPDPCDSQTRAVSADAELRSQTGQFGAGVDVSWDSAGRSDLEWSFTGGVSVSHYAIEQSIPRVQTSTGCVASADTMRSVLAGYCASHPRVAGCSPSFRQALNGVPANLDFERLSGGATATLFLDTDVSLLADSYVYNQDPSQIGYAGVAFLGRDTGLPIAPLRYIVRPEVAHRFGDLTAKLWAQAGEYVTGTAGSTAAIGARVQYRVSSSLRAWVSISGQRDVDSSDNRTRSGSFAAGAGYRW
jgi:hypothetical protein